MMANFRARPETPYRLVSIRLGHLRDLSISHFVTDAQ
jgi:hypothetical protein